jgi:hypothetical protein
MYRFANCVQQTREIERYVRHSMRLLIYFVSYRQLQLDVVEVDRQESIDLGQCRNIADDRVHSLRTISQAQVKPYR